MMPNFCGNDPDTPTREQAREMEEKASREKKLCDKPCSKCGGEVLYNYCRNGHFNAT